MNVKRWNQTLLGRDCEMSPAVAKMEELHAPEIRENSAMTAEKRDIMAWLVAKHREMKNVSDS